MPRCANERDTGLGLGWSPPAPMPLRIETPHLVIRAWELADAPALFEAITASREHLRPWMPWARDGHADLEATTHYITTHIMASRDAKTLTAVPMGIFDRATGRLLGGSGVHGVHRDTAGAEMGYWIRVDAAGKGLATESTAHLLSWAFRPQTGGGGTVEGGTVKGDPVEGGTVEGSPVEGGLGLRRIVIYCSAENVKSRRIPEKLGLRLEVEQRQDFFVREVGVTDRLGWGVLAEEWDCERHRLRRA